jgi:hypothetical protein
MMAGGGPVVVLELAHQISNSIRHRGRASNFQIDLTPYKGANEDLVHTYFTVFRELIFFIPFFSIQVKTTLKNGFYTSE